MAQEKKRVLIVDDNMVDRMILKSILETSFRVIEADSGKMAFEYITMMRDELDAIMLDLSMPYIDGFDVLNFMKKKEIDDIPVLVVSTETTKGNVQRVFQYDVSDVIRKPYNNEDVLDRLRLKLGVIPEYDLTDAEFQETMKYIEDLEKIYKTYLDNFGKSDEPYQRRADLMKILLNTYRRTRNGSDLTPDSITLICKAAYFCDIGEMLISDTSQKNTLEDLMKNQEKEKHTIYGADLIRLNRSKACRYFVEICSSMCLHHHERYDGKGYPYGIKGKCNSVYNQMCRVLDELDERRSKFYGDDKAKPIKFIIGHLVGDGMGVTGKEVHDLLEECEPMIFNYYL